MSGIWQYEYARKLGFDTNHILMHNLSADVSTFMSVDFRPSDYMDSTTHLY